MSESIFVSRAGIFPCPNCRQMIYSDAKRCRFCSVTFDGRVAAQGADLQKRVNAACNQAKMLRNIAGAMWTFFLLGFIPLLMSLVWASNAMFFVVPVGLIYWNVKFGKLQTDDKDYARARRDCRTAFLIWSPALAFEVGSLAIGLLAR
jgi:hypothetical protein